MDGVNKTLYIPLYGKAAVSRQGILLRDPMAEQIWDRAGFPLRGKSKSKWLAYNMGMRAAVFDAWLSGQMEQMPKAAVLHIGCGLDSRACRVGTGGHPWYDLDFPGVIAERRKYYRESGDYHMLGADARRTEWMDTVPAENGAIVVMEGVSMYLRREELLGLLAALTARFGTVSLLMDCYTVFAAKASKYRNPVNEVGVTRLWGVDDPRELERETGLTFLREHDLTPPDLVEQLSGFDRHFFRLMFAGGAAKKIYRLYEFGVSAFSSCTDGTGVL